MAAALTSLCLTRTPTTATPLDSTSRPSPSSSAPSRAGIVPPRRRSTGGASTSGHSGGCVWACGQPFPPPPVSLGAAVPLVAPLRVSAHGTLARSPRQVGVNDDGYGAPERVYGSDGSDHEEGGHGGPPGSVAADLAARYEQDAADAAAEEEALARRHAASGAAYFHSHGRQHGGHDLLTDLPLAGACPATPIPARCVARLHLSPCLPHRRVHDQGPAPGPACEARH